MHPHRGIETITYLIHGSIEHLDSMGNKDVIRAGDSQWMTAGSGILHQEMPQPSQRMLGFQLWLNLPAAQKMTNPAYLSITQDMMPVIPQKTAVLFDQGDFIQLSSIDDKPSRIIFYAGCALHEPIAWGGPIVMNTKEELKHAFDELDKGTFIKHN